ncbi:hypothetical protein [Streptomyces vinaceus]|uniref:hypothetical protein n=1 Tax=Streptomyces vinaceus TaxID=1960 RepID=UPI00369FB380
MRASLNIVGRSGRKKRSTSGVQFPPRYAASASISANWVSKPPPVSTTSLIRFTARVSPRLT